jgi:hypothetical protein
MNSNEVSYRDLNNEQKRLILELILRDGLQNYINPNVLVSLDDNNNVTGYRVIWNADPEPESQNKHLKFQPPITREEEDTWSEWNPKEFQQYLFDHSQGYQLDRDKKLLLQKFKNNSCALEIVNETAICYMDVAYIVGGLHFIGTLSGFYKDNCITFKITWVMLTGIYCDDYKPSIQRTFNSN